MRQQDPVRKQDPVQLQPPGQRQSPAEHAVDVAIVGGGLVGLSLARALAGSGLQIALVDRVPPPQEQASDAIGFDVRVYAISPGSETFLRACGAWPVGSGERIAPVTNMRVFGNTSGDGIAFSAYEAHVAHLASIVENRLLLAALWRSLRAQTELTVFAPARGASVSWEPDAARLTLDDGRRLRANLLVAADGADSWLRGEAGIATRVHPYGQTAVVANFACEISHRGTAFQWFQGSGVLAMLPLPGNRSSMVWSIEDALAEDLMALTPAQLCDRVVDASGGVLGGLELITAPATFPLRLVRVDHMAGPRLALVGDAAHNVHPLAGQGVNLGFQDARELAQVLRQRGTCSDAGEHRLLRRYERARREDVLAMTAVTDGLLRLFGNKRPWLSWLRNRGLNLVDRAEPLKNLLVRHALG